MLSDFLLPGELVVVHPAQLLGGLAGTVRAFSVAVCLLGAVLVENVVADEGGVVGCRCLECEPLDYFPGEGHVAGPLVSLLGVGDILVLVDRVHLCERLTAFKHFKVNRGIYEFLVGHFETSGRPCADNLGEGVETSVVCSGSGSPLVCAGVVDCAVEGHILPEFLGETYLGIGLCESAVDEDTILVIVGKEHRVLGLVGTSGHGDIVILGPGRTEGEGLPIYCLNIAVVFNAVVEESLCGSIRLVVRTGVAAVDFALNLHEFISIQHRKFLRDNAVGCGTVVGHYRTACLSGLGGDHNDTVCCPRTIDCG